MGKKHVGILLKTCISKMPLDEIKEYGDRFIITLSETPGELMMIDLKNLRKALEEIDLYDEGKRNILIKKLCIRSADYNISETGPTAYIGREYVSLLGKPGDEVVIVQEKEGVWKIKRACNGN